MRRIAEAVAEGDIRHRAMRFGRDSPDRPSALQPALAQVMREVVAGGFKQFLQIALGNAFDLRDARRRDFGIVEPAFDGLANPVQQRGRRRADGFRSLAISG